MDRRIWKTGSREFEVTKESGSCEMTVKPVEPVENAAYESAVIRVEGGADTTYFSVNLSGRWGNTYPAAGSVKEALDMAAEYLTKEHVGKDKACDDMDKWMAGEKGE